MKEVEFNPDGLPLVVKIIMLGNFYSAYTFTLFEVNSYSVVKHSSGNNEYDNDVISLPIPTNMNKGRLMTVMFLSKPRNYNQNKNYIIGVEIQQGDVVLAKLYPDKSYSNNENKLTFPSETAEEQNVITIQFINSITGNTIQNIS